MVPNSAGGHAYPVDNMTRLRRFLILGSEGGSYYANERKLTLENAAAVKRCIENDGPKAVYEIAYISRHGRAPKVGPPLFALAMAATYGHLGTRELAFGYLSQMARTGSQLQMFIDYIGTMRGWGRRAPAGCRQLVHSARTSRTLSTRRSSTGSGTTGPTGTCSERPTPRQQARNFWNDLFAWITQDASLPPDNPNFALSMPTSRPRRPTPRFCAALIRAHNMTWEMVPSEHAGQAGSMGSLADTYAPHGPGP